MRRIDKSVVLSTVYKTEIDALEAEGENHPKYYSGHKYYNDVKFALLRCQRGLCAYTEMSLGSEAFYSSDNWKDGQYTYIKGKTETSGQVEHFDSSLKENQGWLWDNLFLVDSDTNNRKRTQEVDNILKPDLEDYDPLDRMEFDFEDNIYIANSKKSNEEQERINNMIETLGINFPGAVHTKRTRFVKRLKDEIELGFFDIEKYKNEEFPTIVRILDQHFNKDNKET